MPASANGTHVPPSSQIVDSDGHVWSLGGSGPAGTQAANSQQVLLDGVFDGTGYGTKLAYCNGYIYTLGIDGQWWWRDKSTLVNPPKTGAWKPAGLNDPCPTAMDVITTSQPTCASGMCGGSTTSIAPTTYPTQGYVSTSYGSSGGSVSPGSGNLPGMGGSAIGSAVPISTGVPPSTANVAGFDISTYFKGHTGMTILVIIIAILFLERRT